MIGFFAAALCACGVDAPSTTVELTINPIRLLADGRVRAEVIVTVRGPDAAARVVDLTATGDGHTFTRASGLTDADGVFVSAIASTSGDTKTVHASVATLGDAETTVTFTPLAARCAGPQRLPFLPMGEPGLRPRIGDFNNDGRLDLLGTDGTSIVLARGGGDGMFEPAVFVGDFASVVPGDFNGDGTLDLATGLDGGAPEVGVSLGNGDGTFAERVTHPALFLRVNAVGDFNGDGRLDLVIGNGFQVARGKGDGTLEDATPVGLQAIEPEAVVVGDFNEDGRDDMFVHANIFEARMALGLEDGRFDQLFVQPFPFYRQVVRGDFDGDGHLDLAFLVNDPAVPANTVGIVRGRGDGTFEPPSLIATPQQPLSIAAGDVDRDGVTDLVIGLEFLHHGLAYVRGRADGNFASATLLQGGEQLASEIALADFDGDGKLDVATDVGPHTLILLGDGAGFAPATGTLDVAAVGLTKPVFTLAAIADLDRDGIPDVIAAAFEDGSASYKLVTLRGRGDATFEPAVAIASTSPRFLVTGDFDRDGDTDVATSDGLRLEVYLNDHGTLVFDNVYSNDDTVALSLADGLRTADVDGDGRLDLITAILRTEEPYGASIIVRLGDGHGLFGPPLETAFPMDRLMRFAAEDLDGDGKADLVVLPPSLLGVMRSRGDGTFETPTVLDTAPDPLRPLTDVAVGDVSGDGILDLVTNVGVSLGTTPGAFAPPRRFDGLRLDERVTVLDLDRDGLLDAVGQFEVGYGAGDGTFARRAAFPLSGEFADLDGDGMLDSVADGRVRRQLTCTP